MSKKCYFLSVIILLIYITICCISSTNSNMSNVKKDNYLTENEIYNSTPTINKESIENTISDSKDKSNYIAKLVIDKLNINNYIYDFNSNKNTVEKNIEILDGSILPNNDTSIIFLAAHSGNGKIAYFKNLDKLEINDEIYFYYKDYKYIYQVVDIFEIIKDGDIELNKISDNQLVLTTCSPNSSDKQLVVNSKLIRKES